MFDDDLKVVMFFLMAAAMFLLARGISGRMPRSAEPTLPPPEPEPRYEPPLEARDPGSH